MEGLVEISLDGLSRADILLVLTIKRGKGRIFENALSGLSTFDMLYLIMGTLIFGFPAISQTYKSTIYVRIMPICYGFGHIGRVGSVFFTVSVTIDRYLAVAHPLKVVNKKRALLYVPVIFTCLYNLPKFFETYTEVSLWTWVWS